MTETIKIAESVKEGKYMNHQEIRSVILKRLYDHEQNGQDFGAEDWKNLGFTEEQISFNTKYLSEKGLIEIGEALPDATNPDRPFLYYGKITAYGIDVVENPETKGKDFPFIGNYIQIFKDVNQVNNNDNIKDVNIKNGNYGNNNITGIQGDNNKDNQINQGNGGDKLNIKNEIGKNIILPATVGAGIFFYIDKEIGLILFLAILVIIAVMILRKR